MSRPTTELAHLFRALKAPAAARALPKLADRARAEDWSYEQFAAVTNGRRAGSTNAEQGRSRPRYAPIDRRTSHPPVALRPAAGRPMRTGLSARRAASQRAGR